MGRDQGRPIPMQLVRSLHASHAQCILRYLRKGGSNMLRVYFTGFIEVPRNDDLDSAKGEVENAVLASGGNIAFDDDVEGEEDIEDDN